MPDQVTAVIIYLFYTFFCLNFAELCLIMGKTCELFNVTFLILTSLVLVVTVLFHCTKPCLIASLQKLESAITFLLYSYKYFVPFAVVCNLKNEFL